MKKFICLLLAVSFLAFAACNNVTPGTQDEVTETTIVETTVTGMYDNFLYEEYSDHVILTGYNGNPVYVTLPVSINDKPVTSFGTIFRSSITLVSVSIPTNASYTAIEDYAFAECNKLNSIKIGNKNTALTRIGSNAFYACQALRTASIPAAVTDIAPDAFKYCTNLVVYGSAGSAVEAFANDFNSIYFRDSGEPMEAETTSLPEETYPVEESSAVEEESSTQENTTEAETTRKKVTTTKKVTTAAPETTVPVPEETTRNLLNLFDIN